MHSMLVEVESMNIPLREYWRLLSRYLVAQRGAALSMAVLLAV